VGVGVGVGISATSGSRTKSLNLSVKAKELLHMPAIRQVFGRSEFFYIGRVRFAPR